MAKHATCDICGTNKLVVSYRNNEQMIQGKIESLTIGFGFTINISTSVPDGHEVCASCARSMRDAVTSTIFNLKRPTVMSHV